MRSGEGDGGRTGCERESGEGAGENLVRLRGGCIDYGRVMGLGGGLWRGMGLAVLIGSRGGGRT